MERVWFERDSSNEMVVDLWREANVAVGAGNLSEKLKWCLLKFKFISVF